MPPSVYERHCVYGTGFAKGVATAATLKICYEIENERLVIAVIMQNERSCIAT